MPIEMTGLTPHIEVFDMPTAVAFYRDVLGFTVANQTQSGDDFAWGLLRCGGAEIMLNTVYERDARPPQPDPSRVAAHRDTTLYIGCPDVDAAYDELRAKGIDVAAPTVSWYGLKQLYLQDPDGYTLCFQHTAN